MRITTALGGPGLAWPGLGWVGNLDFLVAFGARYDCVAKFL